jgi:hypothetical protein
MLFKKKRSDLLYRQGIKLKYNVSRIIYYIDQTFSLEADIRITTQFTVTYGTRRRIAMFRQSSTVPYLEPDISVNTLAYYSISLRYILMLSSHPPQIDLFVSGLPTEIEYVCIITPVHATYFVQLHSLRFYRPL